MAKAVENLQCWIQMWSAGFRLHGQRLSGFGDPGVCSSSWWPDGVCRRTGSHGAEDCDGSSGEVFSLCKCLFPQHSKPVQQTPDGFRPKYMPIFLPACVCVYVYVSFACSTWQHLTLSWRLDVNKRTNQKTNRQQTAPRLKHHLQHKNTRNLPHTSHPPHQWGGSVAAPCSGC